MICVCVDIQEGNLENFRDGGKEGLFNFCYCLKELLQGVYSQSHCGCNPNVLVTETNWSTKSGSDPILHILPCW